MLSLVTWLLAGTSATLFPIHVGDGWGFIDATGRVVIPPTLDHVSGMAEGRAAFEDGVVITGDLHDHTQARWGYIDDTGKVIVPPRYLAAYGFSEGRAAVKCADGTWGYVDATGTEVIPCSLWRPAEFHDGRAIVEVQGGRCAAIDTAGKVAFEMPADVDCSDPPEFSEGHAVLDIGKGSRVVDRDGRVVFEHPGWVRDVHEGKAAFRDASDRYGFLDARSGKVALPPTWTSVSAFRGGFAAAQQDGRWGLIDAKGAWAIPPTFADLDAPTEGLSWATDGKGWGYVDTRGTWVIPPTFEDPQNGACHFDHGLALVRKAGADVWIDATGRQVWPAP